MGRELSSGSWSTGLASQEALLWGGCQPFLSLSLIWVFDVLWLAHWINHTFKDHPWQPWPVKMAFVENQCRSLWDNVFTLNWSPGSDYVPHHSDEICTLKNYARGGLASIFKVTNGITLSQVKSVWIKNMKCNVVELDLNLNPSSWDWQDHTMTSIPFCETHI